MNDALQMIVVTSVALLAMASLVRPYLRRPSSGRSSGCAKCPSKSPCAEPDGAARPLPFVTLQPRR